jgi:RNA polymerase sigma-70 factor, ECF subfamily
MDVSPSPRPVVDPDSALAAIIRRNARSLIGRAGLTNGDREDLEQELHAAVSASFAKFDPARGSPAAFVASVVDRRGKSLLRHASARKRNRRGVQSLSVLIQVKGEGPIELAATISDRELAARLGTSRRDAEDWSDLVQDVDQLIASMPQEDRELIRALKWRTVAEIARSTGVPRTTIQSRIRKYRQLFEDAGLRDYFP